MIIVNRSGFLEERVLVYVTGEELFDEKIYKDLNSLIEDLKEFNFSDVFQSISKINFLLREEYFVRKSKMQSIIANDLFKSNKKILEKIGKYWDDGRLLFSRQQILSLIKVNLLHNKNHTGKKIEEDFYGFGKIIFGISDFLEKKLDKEKEQIIGNIFRNLYLNSGNRLELLLQRYYYLYTKVFDITKEKFPSECFEFNQRFIEITGIDILTYLSLAYSILSKFTSQEDLNKFFIDQDYFKKLKEEIKSNVNKIFSEVAEEEKYFKKVFPESENNFYYNFSPFWSKPLFHIENGPYFLIDYKFLTEKVTSGTFWIIFDNLLKKLGTCKNNNTIEQEINRLKAFYGRCLEYYVYDLLQAVYFRGKLQKVFYSEYEGDDTGNIDFLLDCGKTIFFFEMTSSNLGYNTILSGDYNKIFKEVDMIFFGEEKDDKKGKIIQLDEAIKSFKNNTLKINSISPKDINRIFPILILQSGLPQVPPLNDEYRERILEKGLLEEHIHDFTIIDLEELEYILDLVKCENISITDLFYEYKNSEFSEESLKNFLYYCGYLEKLKQSKNKITSQRYREFHLAVINKLFRKDIVKQEEERIKKLSE